jgi:hypothetical protein
MIPYFRINDLEPWEIEIINKFPLIFLEIDDRVKYYTPNVELSDIVNLRSGFEHGPGWSSLIEKLAGTATELVNFLRKTHYANEVFIHSFICKNKFGGLRWQGNYNLPTPFEKLWVAYIANIEGESYHMCEMTGKYGVKCEKIDSELIKTLDEEKVKEVGYVPIT